MNILGFNIKITRRSASSEHPLSPAAQAWLQGEPSDLDTPTLTNAYQQVVWVYRAINVLAEQIANIRFPGATQAIS